MRPHRGQLNQWWCLCCTQRWFIVTKRQSLYLHKNGHMTVGVRCVKNRDSSCDRVYPRALAHFKMSAEMASTCAR